MPFSSLSDPTDIARAHCALDELWRRIKPLIEDADHQRERDRLVYLVASLIQASHDEGELVHQAWERYWQR